MSLDSLRINACPAAFAEMARKHNALVDLLAAAKGANGISVTVAENNMVIGIGGALTLPGLTVSGSMTVVGDAFFSYVESSGDVYASGEVYRNGAPILPITAADVSDFTAAVVAAAPVTSVAGRTGAVTLTSADLTDVTPQTVGTCDPGGTMDFLVITP